MDMPCMLPIFLKGFLTASALSLYPGTMDKIHQELRLA